METQNVENLSSSDESRSSSSVKSGWKKKCVRKTFPKKRKPSKNVGNGKKGTSPVWDHLEKYYEEEIIKKGRTLEVSIGKKKKKNEVLTLNHRYDVDLSVYVFVWMFINLILKYLIILFLSNDFAYKKKNVRLASRKSRRSLVQ